MLISNIGIIDNADIDPMAIARLTSPLQSTQDQFFPLEYFFSPESGVVRRHRATQERQQLDCRSQRSHRLHVAVLRATDVEQKRRGRR